MYIVTHLGWVVLSCAVLMFFRKRSIQKKKDKKKKKEKQKEKQSKWNSSISHSARGTHGRAPLGMHQGWWSRRVSAELGGLQPTPGDHSVTSQALVLACPGIKFPSVSLWLGALGRPQPSCWVPRPVLGKGRAGPAQSSSVLQP